MTSWQQQWGSWCLCWYLYSLVHRLQILSPQEMYYLLRVPVHILCCWCWLMVSPWWDLREQLSVNYQDLTVWSPTSLIVVAAQQSTPLYSLSISVQAIFMTSPSPHHNNSIPGKLVPAYISYSSTKNKSKTSIPFTLQSTKEKQWRLRDGGVLS